MFHTVRCFSCATLFVVAFFHSCVVADDKDYKPGPDSQKQADVPEGKVFDFEWTSKIYPGTIRRYSVYVPARYDAKNPAALMVFQDGHAYLDPKGQMRATVVMDNLIHRGEIPLMIGLFIDPGHKKEKLPEKRGWEPQPENRSEEYDTVSPKYASFLLDEVLPEVEKSYSITKDPDQRGICGMSSGGICAFVAAWERPDAFRKVISHIGSFVDIRGGHNCSHFVRKQEKKPLRIYLQDGENDLDNRFGNWPLANQEMAAALKFKGYDYQFVYGTGAHSGAHGGAVLPDAMRWLWRKN